MGAPPYQVQLAPLNRFKWSDTTLTVHPATRNWVYRTFAQISHTQSIAIVLGLQDSLTAHYTKTQADNKFATISNLALKKANNDTVNNTGYQTVYKATLKVSTSEIKDKFVIGVDTTAINTSDIYFIGYSDGIVVDSLIYSLRRLSGSPDVTMKLWYGTSQNSAGTAIVTAGNQVTSYSGVTRTGTINNATIPKGNVIWATFSAVSVKPKGIFVTIQGHRQ